jgi:hypothetical protein
MEKAYNIYYWELGMCTNIYYMQKAYNIYYWELGMCTVAV